QGVVYRGSTDDDALNRGVLRYAADPSAAAALAEADDPSGAVSIPVISMHAINDPERFVEQESEYKQTFSKAGASDRLLQLFTTAGEHCNFGAAQTVAQIKGLVRWLDTGTKPKPEEFPGLCAEVNSQTAAGACLFDPKYEPKALDTVLYPRPSESRCGT